MTIFNLPDLGEGLPDAEIVEWHVQEGEVVKADQTMVSMETAKAVVDVPAPLSGKITKLFGKPGDIITTGSPLVEFSTQQATQETPEKNASQIKIETPKISHTQQSNHSKRIKAMPSVRALAGRLGIDLATIAPTGTKDRITIDDVKKAAANTQKSMQPIFKIEEPTKTASLNKTIESLRGVRRAMANAMIQSHTQVVPVTLVDDADINAWLPGTDITWRVIRAIVSACKNESSLNAHFNMEKLERTIYAEINIGIAMDAGDGLFVPVLKNAEKQDQASFRNTLNRFKTQVQNRSIASEELSGSTIQLSNFGTFAGRYANPIVVPPNVAIVGTGKIRDTVVAVENGITIHKIMPLSLTIDHRAITGGEAARFLKAMLDDLRKSQ